MTAARPAGLMVFLFLWYGARKDGASSASGRCLLRIGVARIAYVPDTGAVKRVSAREESFRAQGLGLRHEGQSNLMM